MKKVNLKEKLPGGCINKQKKPHYNDIAKHKYGTFFLETKYRIQSTILIV